MNALFMDNAFSTIHFDKEKFINTPVLNNESKSTKIKQANDSKLKYNTSWCIKYNCLIFYMNPRQQK